MSQNVIVCDIETVPDLKGLTAANGHDSKNAKEVRDAMAHKFSNCFRFAIHGGRV